MRLAICCLLVSSACATSTLRPRAVATLRDALAAPAPEARIAAIEAAERLDEAGLFDPVTRLLTDDDERVRAAAAGATVKGHPDAPRILTESLRATDPAARVIAVTALGRKVGELASADLAAALADSDPRVREAAVVAVAPFAGAGMLLPLAADASGAVRARAVSALARHAKDPAAAAAIVAALHDPYLGARLAAIDGLRGLPSSEPKAGVTIASTHEFLHAAGASAIGLCVTSSDPTLRAAAADAAGKAEIETIRPLLKDPDPAVRLAAARALLRAGRGSEAQPFFQSGLGLPDPWLRLQSAIDLARLGDVAALDPFARDADASTRRAALAAYPYRDDVPRAWVAALDDPEPLVRVTAAELILAKI